ncbi:NDP-hexose 2,3-dehydratase family protein [Lentzea kentuckyensis]|uniref:NDP-hexose 2,3-dehydratase family protein n=1 Tax=Lentzea kentuckyensis TaxID=360086 RepID=UPI000A37EF4A|nr:NDP-hexose 2,3-dehydratase family protein [Lentzea kentuckyensis]
MPPSTTELRRREDTDLPTRLAKSAATEQGAFLQTEHFDLWLTERWLANAFRVERIPFADLDLWYTEAETGNIRHQSGKFFTVEGLKVDTPTRSWSQPIIRQPEVGMLGILVKEFGGVLHCLMQAKMEPGNPNLLQLSPTVQATKSNYTRVHKGAKVKYLEYFAEGAQRGKVIVDVLQSEHGSWFYRKSNRNIVVEVTEDVPLDDDFCWLTLGQVNALLHRDNLVNMDSRTVLSCLPAPGYAEPANDFQAALLASRDPHAGALSATPDVLSWFTGQRADHDIEVSRVPLGEVPGWIRTEDEISREDGKFFRCVAVRAIAGNREVTSWTQPLFEQHGRGVAAFIVKQFAGVLHVLVHARLEGGFLDTVELGPTVQCVPGNYHDAERPPFLDHVLAAEKSRIHYSTVHSEEGGRFLDTESDYLVVEADESFPAEVPPQYTWVTVGQLTDLLRHGRYVNVQARTLVAALNALG